MVQSRDFIGYGNNLPKVVWPGGARLAISLIVNYEEGAELCVEYGDPSCNHIGLDAYAGPGGPGTGVDRGRDLYVEDQFEYGGTTGVWRLLDIFARYDVQATFFCCGKALEMNPSVAKALSTAGHEAASHGYRWVPQRSLSKEEELAHLQRNVDTIAKLTGQRPVGQLTPGVSLHTRELLTAQAGFIYDSDSVADDLPYFTQVNGRKWLVIPYSATSDDYRYAEPAGFVEPNEFLTQMRSDFAQLYKESAEVPKMMSVRLHPRISGLPARSNAVAQFIRYAKSQPGVWFARRDQIAKVWLEQFGG